MGKIPILVEEMARPEPHRENEIDIVALSLLKGDGKFFQNVEERVKRTPRRERSEHERIMRREKDIDKCPF
jgi:hypothetical protein